MTMHFASSSAACDVCGALSCAARSGPSAIRRYDTSRSGKVVLSLALTSSPSCFASISFIAARSAAPVSTLSSARFMIGAHLQCGRRLPVSCRARGNTRPLALSSISCRTFWKARKCSDSPALALVLLVRFHNTFQHTSRLSLISCMKSARRLQK